MEPGGEAGSGQDAWCQPSNNSAWWIISQQLRQQEAYYKAYMAWNRFMRLVRKKIGMMKHMMIIDLRILECPVGKFNFRNSTYEMENSSGLVRQEPGKASSLPKVCGIWKGMWVLFGLFVIFSNFYQLDLHDEPCVAVANLTWTSSSKNEIEIEPPLI